MKKLAGTSFSLVLTLQVSHRSMVFGLVPCVTCCDKNTSEREFKEGMALAHSSREAESGAQLSSAPCLLFIQPGDPMHTIASLIFKVGLLTTFNFV